MRLLCSLCGILVLFSVSCRKDDDYSYEQENDATPATFQGELEWSKRFGGSGDDTAQAVITTTDGGFAILGYSDSADGDLEGKTTAVNDYWLLKLNAEGILQWSKTYGGSKDDRGQALIQTADGGYALTGYAMSDDGDGSNNEGFHDNWIIKLDALGNLEWEKSFGFSGHDHSYDLLQTSDGGFFFVGFLDITSALSDGNYGKGNNLTRHGVGEFWGTKISADGELEWRRYFGGTNNDRAHAVVQAEDGGFVMAGFSESEDFDITNSRGSYDFWVIKIDPDGNLVWERSFGGSGIEIAYDISITKNGTYLVTGNTFSEDKDVAFNHGESDTWLIHLDDNGSLLWEKTYGGTLFDAARSVKTGQEDEIIVSGNTKSSDLGTNSDPVENDIWIFKTDLSGILIWQESYGGSGLDYAFDAVETEERSLLVVGSSTSMDFPDQQPLGNSDLIVLKIH